MPAINLKHDDLFSTLSNLYDTDNYAHLKSLCDKVLRRTLSSDDERHIALSYKALAQIRTRRYSNAVSNAAKALDLFPGCPWTRWVMLYAYEAYGLSARCNSSLLSGIELGERILSDGTRHMRQDMCSKGLSAGVKLTLLNDSRFLLAFLYKGVGRLDEACSMLSLYIRDYSKSYSDFCVEEAKEELTLWRKKAGPVDRSALTT